MRIQLQCGLAASVTVLIGAFSGASLAQDTFPTEPIHLVVNSAAGASVDVSARQYAEIMSGSLGQPVVVENRVGGGGTVGIQHVIGQPADGHTLLVSAGTVAIQQALKENPGFNITEDFVPVGLLISQPTVLVTSTSKPYQTFAEMVAYAEENPGALSFATAGFGTTTHIGPEMYMVRRGLEVEMVPYQGSSAAIPDTLEGRVDGQFSTISTVASHVEADAMRMLAISSSERNPLYPDVPTFAEHGVPDYSYSIWVGAFVPAGTPDHIVESLSSAMLAAHEDEGFREWAGSIGAEVIPMSPAEFSDFVVEDLASLTDFAERTGLTLE